MKTFKTLLCLGILALSATLSQASVTITVGTTGWGNTTQAANNMPWGFLVSSAGTAFTSTIPASVAAALEGFVIPSLANPSTPVQIGSTGYYFVRAIENTKGGGPPAFAAGFMGDVAFNLTGPVGTGDPLALIWFAEGTTTAGSHYGFQNINYTIPSDGANITAGAFSSTPGLATNTIGAVPEPSRAILLGLGVLGVFIRRRR